LPSFLEHKDRKEILDYFLERFGIPEEVFTGFQLFRSGKVIRVISDLPGLREALAFSMIGPVGIPLLRTKRAIWKPTTVGLQIFGPEATRNVLHLDDGRLALLLREQMLQEDLPFETGYVILKWGEHVLSCGFYEKGRLESQIPREWRGMEIRLENPMQAPSPASGREGETPTQ
jgi:NOL1/NOP2/fmu family ribosome biogenesis protein